MLRLAANAVGVIRRATSQTTNPDEAGVRIAPSRVDGQLAVEIATRPSRGDQVLDAGGARVFVAAAITDYVDDLELYAFADSGRVHLAFRAPVAVDESLEG
jgi:Fe-S cluster assembly iron-binding protein IscA